MTVHKDACELLDADHIAVKHLFVEYARLAVLAADPDGRLALAAKICEEITVHARIEEEIFYPALRKVLGADADLLDEAVEEHQEARELIAQIKSHGQADPALDELVASLNRAIEHHVKEERDELFPKARAARDLDLAALGETLAERQQALTGGTAVEAKG